ncbi:hypothetical protein CTKA_02468 [Chthonomonas calidirosea]|uniref:Uncharacterized protein n=1 Tax=Chthonomonas calidirosea (strain DSM 23976 / ICMP 18418 / T49) TaxID=1303518 RepID=S0EYJ7_CHTCT|nr:hypothetical protein CCALI_01632 [Chthonomonas calidirosea T49]CEK20247.1 hypothetical protein CTKA_02468 [Chthonomonas calidirosea]
MRENSINGPTTSKGSFQFQKQSHRCACSRRGKNHKLRCCSLYIGEYSIFLKKLSTMHVIVHLSPSDGAV